MHCPFHNMVVNKIGFHGASYQSASSNSHRNWTRKAQYLPTTVRTVSEKLLGDEDYNSDKTFWIQVLIQFLLSVSEYRSSNDQFCAVLLITGLHFQFLLTISFSHRMPVAAQRGCQKKLKTRAIIQNKYAVPKLCQLSYYQYGFRDPTTRVWGFIRDSGFVPNLRQVK